MLGRSFLARILLDSIRGIDMVYSNNEIKSGVAFYGLRPEMAFCNQFVLSVFNSRGIQCVPTSIVGKKHGTGSLHPVGFAIDYRTKHIKGANRGMRVHALVADLKKALPCCDIVFEYEGKEQEHIHIEYDPKDDEKFVAAKAAFKRSGKWPV